MPLPKRAIVPVNVSNIIVPKEVDNELEYVANATLSNLTRQLASLSLQASDIFTELTEQLIGISNRSERLNQRIESLKVIVAQTAIREDDLISGLMSLQAKPYRSRMEADQQVLNTNSMPKSVMEMVERCEPPPALDQLDRFRYDGKQSMKFYTDPTFFFHLWCQEMLQETKQKKKKKRRRPKKQITIIKKSETHSIKSISNDSNKVVLNGSCINPDVSMDKSKKVNKNSSSINGFELPPPILPPMECHTKNIPQPQFNYEDVAIYNTIAPPKEEFSDKNNANKIQQNIDKSTLDDESNISPPPPAMSYLSHKPGAHPTSSSINVNSNQHNEFTSNNMNDISFRGQMISPINNQENKAVNNTVPNAIDNRILTVPAPPSPPPPPSNPPPPSVVPLPPSKPADNPPSKLVNYAANTQKLDLLTAIRNGIQLRKVGDGDNRPVPISEAVSKAERKFDVQAIFEEVYKRRPYVDNDDSDDGSDEDEDSSLWSSDNDK